ncbi:MAG: sulfite exporter TauE/SafE family protein [Flavobacteriales bacterium]|nr:sulfite exporter TauE/SafE family protein [Flavobacteriales bacterium]
MLIIICLVSFLVAILTFFSGFGLGTILTPVFMVIFPPDLAIALTGVVHFFNNLFKLALVGKKADTSVLIRFGIPAVIAAFIGAYLMLQITELAPLFSYQLNDKTINVSPIKFLVSILLVIFASMELIPYFKKLEFSKNKLPIGGAFSGFFGGLSGNQGALRTAFLIKAGLSKETFIATAVVVSTFVDFTRLGMYASRFEAVNLTDNLPLILSATLSAIAGSFLGNKLLKKVTLGFIQTFVAVMLMVLALGIGSGLL